MGSLRGLAAWATASLGRLARLALSLLARCIGSLYWLTALAHGSLRWLMAHCVGSVTISIGSAWLCIGSLASALARCVVPSRLLNSAMPRSLARFASSLGSQAPLLRNLVHCQNLSLRRLTGAPPQFTSPASLPAPSQRSYLSKACSEAGGRTAGREGGKGLAHRAMRVHRAGARL